MNSHTLIYAKKPSPLQRICNVSHFSPGSEWHSSYGPQCHFSPGPQCHSSYGPQCHSSYGPQSHSSYGPQSHSSPGPQSHSSYGPQCGLGVAIAGGEQDEVIEVEAQANVLADGVFVVRRGHAEHVAAVAEFGCV